MARYETTYAWRIDETLQGTLYTPAVEGHEGLYADSVPELTPAEVKMAREVMSPTLQELARNSELFGEIFRRSRDPADPALPSTTLSADQWSALKSRLPRANDPSVGFRLRGRSRLGPLILQRKPARSAPIFLGTETATLFWWPGNSSVLDDIFEGHRTQAVFAGRHSTGLEELLPTVVDSFEQVREHPGRIVRVVGELDAFIYAEDAEALRTHVQLSAVE